MATRTSAVLILGLALLLVGTLAAQQKPEDIPDAPSATRPIPPPETPSPRQEADDNVQRDTPPMDNSGEGVTTGSKELPHSAPDIVYDKSATPPPMPPVKTVPAGSVPKDLDTGEELYKYRATTTLVLVPVTVKDSNGHLVGGLLPKDFSVLENGQRQTLKFFTSDPFALSAAIIFDTGIPDVALKKVQETLPALQGAFSQFDEVSIYTYSSTVGRVADFTSVGKQLTVALNQVKAYSGANNGPPITSGPLGPQGPYINGIPINSPVNPVSTPPKESRVMNDAILQAARDLSKRDRTRRKIIFIISDGREQGSVASYKDTLKVLLTQNITVYAVGVEGAAIPIYDKLERIHLPKTRAAIGYSDILPKYVSATGGGTVYNELSQANIERAYANAIGEARNQYTLGYSPKSTIGGYRDINVQVRRADMKVYAKAGYYPLPTPR
ncbi:MAG: VWA domain-containing protein [Terriglobales bacterium]